ncbi:MAG TPA: proton-conducting membrane transporter [Firmicutes bacterium]|jgi:NADH:ubiquinone oxidoreductase subunit C|nr:proton-conducting membrane transporter [Bacillota bacterium]
MNNQELVTFLQTQFSGKVTNVTSPREKRIFAEVATTELVKTLQTLKNSGVHFLGTITGVDSGEKFEVIYHLYNDDGIVLNMKTFTPRTDPKVPTVTTVFSGAFLYERELMDLLGIDVEGTPPNRRYPLPDDWPVGQFPLRKDWKSLSSEEEVNKA